MASAPAALVQTASRIAMPISVPAPVTTPVPSAMSTGLSIPTLELTARNSGDGGFGVSGAQPANRRRGLLGGVSLQTRTDSDRTVFIIGHEVAGARACSHRCNSFRSEMTFW